MTTKKSSKRVAILGCGKAAAGKEGWAIGHHHAQGYLASGMEVELCGVDISPENLAAFGERFAVPKERLFSSTADLYQAGVPDCVSVCTWPALHHPMVVEALEAGVRGIACEKPFALDTAEIRDLEKRVQAKDAILVVAHQRRLEAGFRKLKEVARSGRLGNSLVARGRVGDDWDILSWSVHWFDMANFLFDAPPEWVMAGMEIGQTRRYQHAVEDASIIYAQYAEGQSGIFLTGPGEGANFSVEGDEGLARIRENFVEVATFAGCEKIPFDTEAPGGWTELVAELMRALNGGPEPMCSIRHSAVATEMAYAAQESARTGRKVFLPLQALYAPLEVAQHPLRSSLTGRRVLLLADSHFGSGGREGISAALADLCGAAPSVVDAEARGLVASDLQEIDAIAMYHTQKEADPETRQLLAKWVSDGRPLLILHCGLGAWPEWKEYAGWCGMVWAWGKSAHPHEPSTLRVAEGDPMHFGWSEAWLPKDEVFIKLETTEKILPALTVEIPQGVYPAAWRSVAHPSVGVWVPGHREDLWRLPAMRDGMARVLSELLAGQTA